MVSLTLRVLHRPDVKALPKIYQNLGQDYDERVLPSIGNEVLKAIVAQFDAAELITQREQVWCPNALDDTRDANQYRFPTASATSSSSAPPSSTLPSKTSPSRT